MATLTKQQTRALQDYISAEESFEHAGAGGALITLSYYGHLLVLPLIFAAGFVEMEASGTTGLWRAFGFGAFVTLPLTVIARTLLRMLAVLRYRTYYREIARADAEASRHAPAA